MVQKFRENVEISNKVNFRDYSKVSVILRPRVVLPRPLTQLDRIASKREMPRVEIQSFIKKFLVYKARQLSVVFSSGVYFLRSSFVPFHQQSVTCLLAASIQEEGIRLYKGAWKFGQ